MRISVKNLHRPPVAAAASPMGCASRQRVLKSESSRRSQAPEESPRTEDNRLASLRASAPVTMKRIERSAALESCQQPVSNSEMIPSALTKPKQFGKNRQSPSRNVADKAEAQARHSNVSTCKEKDSTHKTGIVKIAMIPAAIPRSPYTNLLVESTNPSSKTLCIAADVPAPNTITTTLRTATSPGSISRSAPGRKKPVCPSMLVLA